MKYYAVGSDISDFCSESYQACVDVVEQAIDDYVYSFDYGQRGVHELEKICLEAYTHLAQFKFVYVYDNWYQIFNEEEYEKYMKEDD